MKILQNLKHDLPASIIVFFVALPLCLGIALASGAPLFSGIIAGIVGGIVVGSLSGSALGVSGPAAGLATIVFSYIAALGGSWESFLLAVVISGVIQIALGYLKLGTIAYYFPSSVIKGMLAGIGLLIIIKQLPHALGYDINFAKDFGEEGFCNESPIEGIKIACHSLNSAAFLISAVSVVVLIVWDSVLTKVHGFFKAVPAPLAVVVVGIIFYNLFARDILPFKLEDEHLVKIPTSSSAAEFFAQFHLPNFSQLTNPDIYLMALTLAVVGSLETLLSVEACDKIDPQKRVTPTNRELKAQGAGNIISGLLGGLPITQVIVRSSANVEFGAKTKLSTILHGLILFIAVISIPRILNMIPLASLACILIFVGYKLAKPSLFQKIYKLGFEQFLPFAITIAGMLVFDLLKGVGFGMVVALGYVIFYNFKNSYQRIENSEGRHQEHVFKLAEEVSFLNKGSVLQMLKDIPEGAKAVIDGTHSRVIHHDVVEIIRDFQISAKSRNIDLELKGIDFRKFK